MKVGFPTYNSSESTEFKISPKFSSLGYFGVYDSECEKVSAYAPEEMGSSMIDWLDTQQIKTIITPSIHQMAYKMFAECGVKIYCAQGDRVDENIKHFRDGVLAQWTSEKVLESNPSSCGGSDCSSCESKSETCEI